MAIYSDILHRSDIKFTHDFVTELDIVTECAILNGSDALLSYWFYLLGTFIPIDTGSRLTWDLV